MIEVVLDTNVLVAALLAPRGEHAAVLMKVLEHPQAFNLVVSSQIIDEYRGFPKIVLPIYQKH